MYVSMSIGVALDIPLAMKHVRMKSAVESGLTTANAAVELTP